MTVLLGIFVLIVLYKLALMREEKALIKKEDYPSEMTIKSLRKWGVLT